MRIKKRHLKLGAVGVALLVVAAALLISRPPPWSVDDAGYLYLHVGSVPVIERARVNESSVWTEERIVFSSSGAKIYGLLFTAKTPSLGILLLPGGGVRKEDERRTALILAEMGYTVLTIDQRGIGETDGYYPSLDQDYVVYSQGKEPMQHLQIADALAAAEVLRHEIRSEKIVYMGESMGGRVAVVAGALDSKKSAVIIVSSAGYGTVGQDSPAARFLGTFDPDRYVSQISPTPLLMLHSIHDTTIPIENARELFSRAQDPKQFVSLNDTACTHGYCGAMTPYVKEFLGRIE